MNFLEIINKKKMTLISIGLLIYVATNLFYGKRGLISYFEKKNMINYLFEKKENLNEKLSIVEKRNNLLTDIVDVDYLETLYREKFMVGKKKEKVFVE